MPKFKVIDEVRSWVTDPADADDSWSRDSTDQSHDIRGIELVDEKGWGDMEVKFDIEPGKTYYLLSVIYDTGDTFGRDGGQIEFIDLYEDHALAEKNAKTIAEHARSPGDYFKKHDSLKITTNLGTEYQLSPSWVGYFESFDEARVSAVQIGGSSYR